MCYRCISNCPQQAITLLGKKLYEQCKIEKYLWWTKWTYDKEFIDAENTFTVSIPYNKTKETALDICGHNSGRNVNKEELANIKFISSNIVDSPIVDGCNRYYECKVIFKQVIDSSKIDKETNYEDREVEHTLYFSEIVAEY